MILAVSRDRLSQLENLAQVTQNNVDLGLQLLQEQMLAIQQQLIAIAEANPSNQAEPIRPPEKFILYHRISGIRGNSDRPLSPDKKAISF